MYNQKTEERKGYWKVSYFAKNVAIDLVFYIEKIMIIGLLIVIGMQEIQLESNANLIFFHIII